MGATEEVGKVATSGIEALKSTPVLLSILIFNLAFMGVIGWMSHNQGEKWEKVFELVIRCKEN